MRYDRIVSGTEYTKNATIHFQDFIYFSDATGMMTVTVKE